MISHKILFSNNQTTKLPFTTGLYYFYFLLLPKHTIYLKIMLVLKQYYSVYATMMKRSKTLQPTFYLP